MSKETADWLEDKRKDWEKTVKRTVDAKGKKRRRDGVGEFAAYIGVSRNTMNNWLTRLETPSEKSADKIASRFGPEIYDLIGSTQSDPLFREFRALWGKLTYGQKVGIVDDARQAAGLGATRGGERVLAEAQLP